MTGALTGPQN